MHQSWGNTLAIKVPHLVVAKSPGCLGATKNKDKLTQTRCSELVVDVLEAKKCHYCSSKPCLLFGPFEHKSLQQRRIVQCKKVNCEVVSGHHCWFDIARPITYFPISTSSKFACLASRPNAIGKGAMVPQLFFQAVLASWHMWNQISTANATLPEL